MAKLIVLKKETYEEYVSTYALNPHFSQSSFWSEIIKKENDDTVYYLALLNKDNMIIAATTLFSKTLSNHTYFYAPAGFILDYSDEDTVKKMTKAVAKFIKKRKGLFLFIDPMISKSDINNIQTLRSLGFKQNDFSKAINRQSKIYTSINLMDDFSSISNENTNKANFFKVKIKIDDKKDSTPYNKELFQELNKNNMATLFSAHINLDYILERLNTSSKEIKNQLSILPIDNLSKSAKNKFTELKKQQSIISEDIKKFTEHKTNYGENISLNSMMIVHYKDKAWLLKRASHKDVNEPYINDYLYNEMLKHLSNMGIKEYFELKDDYNFMSSFNTKQIKYTDNFIYITNHTKYFIYNKLLPWYRKKKNKVTKEVDHDS